MRYVEGDVGALPQTPNLRFLDFPHPLRGMPRSGRGRCGNSVPDREFEGGALNVSQRKNMEKHVVGAGLAGCEAAWQLAGVPVTLSK